jgi:hypothetical protein
VWSSYSMLETRSRTRHSKEKNNSLSTFFSIRNIENWNIIRNNLSLIIITTTKYNSLLNLKIFYDYYSPAFHCKNWMELVAETELQKRLMMLLFAFEYTWQIKIFKKLYILSLVKDISNKYKRIKMVFIFGSKTELLGPVTTNNLR